MKVLVTTKNNISAPDKAKLRKAGVIVVEADKPELVNVIDTDANYDIMMSAVKAINEPFPKNTFCETLFKRLKLKDQLSNETYK